MTAAGPVRIGVRATPIVVGSVGILIWRYVWSKLWDDQLKW